MQIVIQLGKKRRIFDRDIDLLQAKKEKEKRQRKNERDGEEKEEEEEELAKRICSFYNGQATSIINLYQNGIYQYGRILKKQGWVHGYPSHVRVRVRFL